MDGNRLRFGFVAGRELTVQEVAEELRLVPFRVRRSEAKGLRILHHPELSGRLKWHKLCYFE